MIVRSGARLGPYEIIGPLGIGALGEAYRNRLAHGRSSSVQKVANGSTVTLPDA